MKMKKILVTGRFNVLHPGHIRLLRFAKECGDVLIVGVESDLLSGKEAHVPEDLRLEGILSNSLVDEAYIIRNSVEMFIEEIKPNILVKGKEHENAFNPEIAVLKKFGGKLLFSSGETFFSSIDLLNKEEKSERRSITRLPNDFLNRHFFDKKRLKTITNGFNELRVCVIGDLIVDEYINCQPLGMSQEDPTIVVTPIDTKKFIGGAGIVAAHAAGLGSKVEFISVAGNDISRKFAVEILKNFKVDTSIFIDKNRPTTLKQRYRSRGKSMLRVSYLHQDAISIELQKKILARVKKNISQIDLLVFSDFNYGCLPQNLIDEIVKLAKYNNIMMSADCQSSSQIGDISKFKGMNLITPTEREARISTRNHEDGLVILADKLRRQANAENIILKMGEEGVLIHINKDETTKLFTDRIPALNSNPVDVAGAGDSLLITSSMSMACGANIWESSLLGSIAASIQVGRIGNTPLQLTELINELNK
jgi:rfaE bifunctional protein kinase chain/domain